MANFVYGGGGVNGPDGLKADVIPTDGHNGLVAIAPGHVSTINSTAAILAGDAVFTGDWEDVTNFGVIVVSMTADVDSAVNGLMVQFSSDGTVPGIIADDDYTVLADAKKTFSFQTAAKFFRVLFTNGASPQTIFNLQVVLKPYYVKPSSHRVQDSIIDDDDAELIKSVITGKNPSDIFVNFQATTAGNFKGSVEEIEPETIANFDTDLAIARNLVPSIESDSKFGRAPAGVQVSATDIWDRADANATQQIWLPPTAPRIHAIVSTLDADSDVGGSVAQGQGGRTLEVFGLVDWDTAESSEIVILDGTNPKNTVSPYVIIHRMVMLTWGTSGPNAGVITATAAAPDSTVTAQINIGNGQTNMTIWGIPSTQTAYLRNYYAAVHEAASPATANEVDVALLLNPSPDVLPEIFIHKYPLGVTNTGASYISHNFEGYIKFPGPSIIKIQGVGSSADLDVSAGFEYKLIDN